MSMAVSEMDDIGRFKSRKTKNKTPFGNPEPFLAASAVNLNTNMNDLGKTYGAVFVPRNVSFAKNLIDNYETNPLQNKRYERKKNKEMNISQAINDYNSYKIFEKSKNNITNNNRFSRSPPPLSSSRFNLRESQFGINPKDIRGKKVPLNLLEIFSNTEIGALSINFTKYNNPITIDNLAVQIGTIRLNLYVNYLLDILRILSEYQKATMIPKIVKSEQPSSPGGKIMLDIEEYFYDYMNKIPNKEKTESIMEYMDYLKKKISAKKKFSSKPEHFILNQIFEIFPKGFDFVFDYENIEIVAYDKNNSVSSKVIVPSNECIFGINFSRIFVKLLDLEVEVTDINKIESILNQLKELAEDKFKVVQIVIEPCYKQIKEGIEPILKDNQQEYRRILRNNNVNNANNNKNNNININNINIDNNALNNQQKNQEKILMQKQKDKELVDLMIKNHKENELLIKKQKLQQEQEQLNIKKPLDNDQKRLINSNQVQQKKNMIPKNPHAIKAHANYFQQPVDSNEEISYEPRDSKRSKKDKNNIKYNLPRVGNQKTGSYQSYENINLNEQQKGINSNFNINLNPLDYNNNNLYNTNYNIKVPNLEENYNQYEYDNGQTSNYSNQMDNNQQNIEYKDFNLI